MRIKVGNYKGLDLRAHTFLHDVEVLDVWEADFQGGGSGRTIADFDALDAHEALIYQTPGVSALFRLRMWLGKIFGWDEKPEVAADPSSFCARLTDEDRARSITTPGSALGDRLYTFKGESLDEIINGTVHAFAVTALIEKEGGYRLIMAVYVKPKGWITPWYMALINPFRRWFVYPVMLRLFEKTWRSHYGDGAGTWHKPADAIG